MLRVRLNPSHNAAAPLYLALKWLFNSVGSFFPLRKNCRRTIDIAMYVRLNSGSNEDLRGIGALEFVRHLLSLSGSSPCCVCLYHHQHHHELKKRACKNMQRSILQKTRRCLVRN